MKRAVRTIVLVVAVACTCLATAAPISNMLKGGPIPTCKTDDCR